MTTEKARTLKQGDEVYFAGAFYAFAELKEYPHGPMVGIYDERPKNNHIDYLSPDGLGEVLPCTRCQGGGCLDCSGFGKYV